MGLGVFRVAAEGGLQVLQGVVEQALLVEDKPDRHVAAGVPGIAFQRRVPVFERFLPFAEAFQVVADQVQAVGAGDLVGRGERLSRIGQGRILRPVMAEREQGVASGGKDRHFKAVEIDIARGIDPLDPGMAGIGVDYFAQQVFFIIT